MMNKEKISDECAANKSLKQPASQSVQGKTTFFHSLKENPATISNSNLFFIFPIKNKIKPSTFKRSIIK